MTGFTIILLLMFYIIGIYAAWCQIQHWNHLEDSSRVYDSRTLLRYSLLSWLVYPVHYIIRLFNRNKDS